jgi:hypothetical protein
MECNFFFQVFKKNYIAIWSFMLLEDVMQAFPLLPPQVFVNQFAFIWGCEQCTRALGQFIVGTYYYFKDLNSVYTFHVEGYPMG